MAVENRKRTGSKSGSMSKRTSSKNPFNIMIGVIVCALAIVLCLGFIFKISSVEVVGNSHYSDEEIIFVSEIPLGESILSLHSRQAEQNVLNNMNYIEDVKISFKFPASAKIEVTEAVQAFVLENETGRWILSSNWKTLEQLDGEIPEKLTLITGIEFGTDEKIKYKNEGDETILNNILSALDKNDLHARMIDFSNINDVKINYQERIIISIGYPEKIDEKMILAAHTLKNELSNEKKGILNMWIADKATFREDYGNLEIDYSIPQ